jgi:hypothetical protein
MTNLHPIVPDIFCWTKFGIEAAQPIEVILARKEQERLANQGVFLWGVGNAILPSIATLVKKVPRPEVLFSPISTRPRAVDVTPKGVVAWRAGITPSGARWDIPISHLCTSGFDSESPRRPHYALICSSDQPLKLELSAEKIFPSTLSNLVSGNCLGASQVTAVVEYNRDFVPVGRSYEIAMRARLVPPYCVLLVDPVIIPPGYIGSSRQPDWRAVDQRQPTLFGNS